MQPVRSSSCTSLALYVVLLGGPLMMAGRLNSQEKSSSDAPVGNHSSQQFHFDRVTSQCRDLEGRQGLNNGLLSCGDPGESSLKDANLRGRDLSGARLRDLDLEDADLSEAE